MFYVAGHAQPAEEQELSAGWLFRQADEEAWLPAEVPGCVHTDLLANEVIEDPFYRLNEKDLQWIDKKNWVYRLSFEAMDHILAKEQIELVFEGLDTYAELKLNGREILSADNMFRSWTVDVKGILQKENVLEVLLKSPTLTGLEKMDAYGYPLPASNDQSENGGMGDKRVSIFVRKAPYHFGWDWGPRLVTSGIWRPVKLKAWDEVQIDDVFISTAEIGEVSAEMKAQIRFSENPGKDAEIIIKAKGVELISSRPDAGRKSMELSFAIETPELWWPNGMGEQSLYDFEVILKRKNKIADVWTDKVGIRTVELVREPDEKGESFYFRINGKPVFAKGANYIPNDVFVPRVADSVYEHIIKSAADAHMNMIRVWGGGIYENEIFYDLCDKYGLMVWQDFMFACSMYPGNDAFLENVRAEAEENIQRLRNHPSIVLWCGNNEIEAAWGPRHEDLGWGWKQRYDEQQRKEIWQAYDTVFHHILPEVVENHHPGMGYWPSSPTAGEGELAGWDTPSGDIHYWGVWHAEHPFSGFKENIGRFMSEYGFQSFPEYQSVQHYTVPDDHDIESEVMMAHQRSGIGNLRIRSYMEDHYRVPEDFADFLYVGQLLQAEGIKMAVDVHRAAMPYCMGTLYWQLNDCWPVASWSGIDYYGQWKAMHYFVRDANKPVSLMAERSGDEVDIRLVSDKQEQQLVEVSLEMMGFSGKVLERRSYDVNIGYGESVEVVKMESKEFFDGLTEDHLLYISAESDGVTLDTETLYFAEPKDLNLPDANVSLELENSGNDFVITLNTDKLAKNVFLYLEDVYAGYKRFSDNYFDLVPGKEIKVTYPATMDLEKFKSALRVKHLVETY